jgi:hypothetical protein
MTKEMLDRVKRELGEDGWTLDKVPHASFTLMLDPLMQVRENVVELFIKEGLLRKDIGDNAHFVKPDGSRGYVIVSVRGMAQTDYRGLLQTEVSRYNERIGVGAIREEHIDHIMGSASFSWTEARIK